MIDRDDDAQLTDADLDSQTRFGTRPVPEGHRMHGARHDSRRIPPHGDVSPDGKRVWPRPSLTARILVWGGTAAAVAGVTAGAVILGRQIGQSLSADRPEKRHRTPAQKPRRGPHEDTGRADVREGSERVSAQSNRYRSGAGRADKPSRRRSPTVSLVDEIEASSERLTGTVAGLVGSLGAAFSGFRTVASQANGIIQEFGDTADLIRNILHPREVGPKTSSHSSGAAHATPKEAGPEDERRMHRL